MYDLMTAAAAAEAYARGGSISELPCRWLVSRP